MDTKIKIGALIEDNNGEILLIKEKTDSVEVPKWNIIQGTYGDVPDESILDAAVRECMEEASVKVELKNLLGIYSSRNKNSIRTLFAFTAKIISGIPSLASKEEQVTRNESIQELKWFSKDELSKMSPADFISQRTYAILKDWKIGIEYPLDVCIETTIND